MGNTAKKALVIGAGVGLAGVALNSRKRVDLQGKRVLVTGGSKGLGLLLAREFSAAGCRVAICARDQGELDWAGNFLAEHGLTRPHTIVCDVSDRAQVERMVSDATDALGGVDVLVNNAGVIQIGRHETMEIQDFEEALGTMFWGALYPTMALLPQMRARREGYIVNITSIGGKVSVPHLLPYCSAKFAAVGFSEGLHAELSGTGVHVVTVVPGLMRTGSFISARAKGEPEAEAVWFGLGASVPFISMDAEAAARRIRTAVERRETEVILNLPANAIARLQGLAPGMTSHIMTAAEKVISSSKSEERGEQLGLEATAPIWRPPLSFASYLGRRSVRRFQPVDEERIDRLEAG